MFVTEPLNNEHSPTYFAFGDWSWHRLRRSRSTFASALLQVCHGTDSSCGELELPELNADYLTRESDGRHLTANGHE